MQVNKAQKTHNYAKFMELCRASLNGKNFNTVSLTKLCSIAKVSTNCSKVLLKEGYVEKGKGATYRATAKFFELGVGEFMQMVANYYLDHEKRRPEPLEEVVPVGATTGQELVYVSPSVEQLKLPIAELQPAPVDKVLRWEPVSQSFDTEDTTIMLQESAIAERAKVPGGWLLRMYRPNQYNDSVTYIPDPKNTWA